MAERGVTVTYETIRAWCYNLATSPFVQRPLLADFVPGGTAGVPFRHHATGQLTFVPPPAYSQNRPETFIDS